MEENFTYPNYQQQNPPSSQSQILSGLLPTANAQPLQYPNAVGVNMLGNTNGGQQQQQALHLYPNNMIGVPQNSFQVPNQQQNKFILPNVNYGGQMAAIPGVTIGLPNGAGLNLFSASHVAPTYQTVGGFTVGPAVQNPYAMGLNNVQTLSQAVLIQQQQQQRIQQQQAVLAAAQPKQHQPSQQQHTTANQANPTTTKPQSSMPVANAYGQTPAQVQNQYLAALNNAMAASSGALALTASNIANMAQRNTSKPPDQNRWPAPISSVGIAAPSAPAQTAVNTSASLEATVAPATSTTATMPAPVNTSTANTMSSAIPSYQAPAEAGQSGPATTLVQTPQQTMFNHQNQYLQSHQLAAQQRFQALMPQSAGQRQPSQQYQATNSMQSNPQWNQYLAQAQAQQFQLKPPAAKKQRRGPAPSSMRPATHGPIQQTSPPQMQNAQLHSQSANTQQLFLNGQQKPQSGSAPSTSQFSMPTATSHAATPQAPVAFAQYLQNLQLQSRQHVQLQMAQMQVNRQAEMQKSMQHNQEIQRSEQTTGVHSTAVQQQSPSQHQASSQQQLVPETKAQRSPSVQLRQQTPVAPSPRPSTTQPGAENYTQSQTQPQPPKPVPWTGYQNGNMAGQNANGGHTTTLPVMGAQGASNAQQQQQRFGMQRQMAGANTTLGAQQNQLYSNNMPNMASLGQPQARPYPTAMPISQLQAQNRLHSYPGTASSQPQSQIPTYSSNVPTDGTNRPVQPAQVPAGFKTNAMMQGAPQGAGVQPTGNALPRMTWTSQYEQFIRATTGGPAPRIPHVGGKPIDMYALFYAVVGLGGFTKVSHDRKWRAVVEKLGLLAFGGAPQQLKKAYGSLLAGFEGWVMRGERTQVQHGLQQQRRASGVQGQHPQAGLARPNVRYAPYPLQNSSVSQPQSVPHPSSAVPHYSQSAHLARPGQSIIPAKVAPPDPVPPPKPVYKPAIRKIESYGGLDLKGFVPEIIKPVKNLYGGKVDLRRIVMSLKSGMDLEIRWAIDLLCLATGPSSGIVVPIAECEGLLAVLCSIVETWFNKYTDENERAFISYADLLNGGLEENMKIKEAKEGTLDREETEKEQALAVGTILRNLTFFAENQKVMAEDTRMLRILREMLGGRCGCRDKIEQATILEHRKNAVVMLSNIGAFLRFPGPDFCRDVMDVLSDCLQHPESSYAYPALEALAKLTLVYDNAEFLIRIKSLQLVCDRALQMLPTDGLKSDVTTEELASWEMASIAIQNLANVGDSVKKLLVKIPGFVGLMIRLSRPPASDVRVAGVYQRPVLPMQGVSQRSMRTLGEIVKEGWCRGIVANFEKELVGIVSKGVGDDEVERLAGEVLWGLHEE